MCSAERPQPTSTGSIEPSTSSAELSRASVWVRALAAKVFGNRKTVELERRLLAGVMLVCLASGVVATIQTFIIGDGLRMAVPAMGATVVSAIGFWLARTLRAWRKLVGPFFIVMLLLLSGSWITEDGTRGTIAFYFFLTACYAAIFFEGRKKAAAIGAVLATVTALSIVEYRFPALILPYDSPSKRFADVVLTLLLCLFLLAFFVYRVYREYQRERAAKDSLLRMVTEEKDRVERSMREKQRLLSIVSHDIANALTVLQGEIGLARLPARNGAVGDESLERMEYACKNIAEIIGSVRMVEAVAQGLLKFEPKPVDLQAVFKTAEMLFAERLLERNIRIVFPELRPENRFVMADPRILANHVFSNLVSNAIKFSYPDSTIRVTVDRGQDQVIIRVVDRGIGMAPALVAKLFDLDAKTTRPGVDGRPGTGFGMRTVKSFVDLFGGVITIESKEEKAWPDEHGTVVAVRLPPYRG